MRVIYKCIDCNITVECETGDPTPPEGWKQKEQVDGKKSWYCKDCSEE